MELQIIREKIFEIRGQKIMPDFDLAELYEVETKVFNQAVKRNIENFPEDFMFRLTVDEWQGMRSQKKEERIYCLTFSPNMALQCSPVC